MSGKATAVAGANIAFTKYWGRRDAALNTPLNPSLGLTLDNLLTTTTVEFRDDLPEDTLVIGGEPQGGKPLERVARVLDAVRDRSDEVRRARVVSENTFAAATGLASSASAFAALVRAAFGALGEELSTEELSTYARLGSGSAARSVPGGFVEWTTGKTHEESRAWSLHGPDHWDLRDVALVVSGTEKKVGSADGHGLANTSPFNDTRIRTVEAILPRVRQAIADRDLTTLGELMEHDALLMHGVMMTSTPSLLYWTPATVEGIHLVRQWREEGIPAYFTIDAGPNLHVFCEGRHADEVARRAREEMDLREDQVLVGGPGEGARLVGDHLF